MRLMGWLSFVACFYFFIKGVEPGKDTSMYIIPMMLTLLAGIILLGKAPAYEKKQAEKKENNQTADAVSRILGQDRFLSDFPKSYLMLACALLFNNRLSMLTGLFSIPWGTIRNISILALLILPAMKAFPKRNLYLGLAMIGYGLGSLRTLTAISFNVYMIGNICILACTAIVFFGAGLGLLSEKHRKLGKNILIAGEGLFVSIFALSLMAPLGSASDEFREFGLTLSFMLMPGLVLIAAGLVYGDYVGTLPTTNLVNRRTALIALAVALALGLTPIRNLVAGGGYYSRPSYSYSNYSKSGSSVGAGGYDMPRSGESFSDYVKRVDPGLYRDMEDRYNNLK